MRSSYILLIAALCVSLASAAEPDKKKDKPAKNKIKHAALGAKVTVSSTSKDSEGESGPKALVDGDLTTRWSSAYAAPQRITIELGREISISEIRLHWEAAYATKYHILVSDDGEGWIPAHYFFRMGHKTEARVDKCKMKGVKAQYILIELDERVNDEWGFSLYEIEVVPASSK